VTRGQLPQRAGSLGLNGGGAAAAVPPSATSQTVSVNCTPRGVTRYQFHDIMQIFGGKSLPRSLDR